MKKKGWYFLLATVLLFACKEREIYPDVPSLTWKTGYFIAERNAFGTYDTLIGIVVSYKDGDGDIGLNEADTFPPFNRDADSLGEIRNEYYYNLHVDYLEMKNGNLVPFIIPNTTDTFKVQTRISSLTPDGVHKAIRGDIDFQFSPPLYPGSISDSVVLRVRLYDRGLHQSNVVESPLFVLP